MAETIEEKAERLGRDREEAYKENRRLACICERLRTAVRVAARMDHPVELEINQLIGLAERDVGS